MPFILLFTIIKALFTQFALFAHFLREQAVGELSGNPR